ncbi:MAG: TRAP transporter large permease subunit, partial [Gammaproteobacteria bacterium]
LGYDKSYALGVIAGSGSLGMLIPPSILLIVWAILTEASVGALFLGGVVPGLLLGLVFVLHCAYRAWRNPNLAPTNAPLATPDSAANQPVSGLVSGLAILLLVVLVLGGIWLGVFTPTEAAGFGVVGSLLIGWAKGMKRADFMQAIFESGRSTAPILILLIAGSMYSRMLAVSGGMGLVEELFTGAGLGAVGTILVMTLVWLLLGTIIDSISGILLTVPVFFPIAMAAGINEVAFAIYGIIVIEAGLLTPPLGLLIFTVKSSVPDSTVTQSEIFKGALPYWILMLAVASMIFLLPGLASWLPSRILG